MPDTTPYPVFISYARKTSRETAEALHRALGGDGGLPFLDTSDIEAGEHFPKALLDALLGAKVVVAFVDETYFQKRYCFFEWDIALMPYHALSASQIASEQEKRDALSHLVVALPQQGASTSLLNHLPPPILTTNCHSADETDALAELIRSKLNSIELSIGERIGERSSSAVRTTALEDAALPRPVNLAGRVLFPLQLPESLGRGFVGRAHDLWRIHYALTSMRGEPATSAALTGALEGFGGVGKTRIATEYVHRFGGDYPGGLFWIDADVAEERLQDRFHGVLRTIKADTPNLIVLREQFRAVHGNEEGFSEELRRRLGEALHQIPPEKPSLFVVDNVPEAPAGILPKSVETWCPAIGKVSVLATSRAKILGNKGVIALPVDTLDRKSAMALLTFGVDRRALDEAKWERLAEWVGDLPLALELLQQALVAGAIWPGELFDRSSQLGTTKELDGLMEAIRGHVPEKSLRGITEALQISYERLSDNAKKLARILCFLSPDPIPMAIIDALGPDNAPAEARAALIARSFVTQVPSGAVSFFGKMHSVLADFLCGCSDAPEIEALAVARILHGLVDPDVCRDPKNWSLMSACLPHCESLVERLSGSYERAQFQEVIKFSQRIGILLSAQGLLQRARKLKESTLDLAQRVLGKEHPDTLASMNNLAGTLEQLGDLAAARRLEEHVLEMLLRVVGDDHPTIQASMINLAETLRAQGDLAGARNLQESALRVLRRTHGVEHPNTLDAMNNLALTFAAQGDVASARELHEQVLEARLRILGEDHPSTLMSMGNLGGSFAARGNHVQARTLRERTLQLQRKVLGDEHPDTVTTMHNLASSLIALGDFPNARMFQERVLRARIRVLGEGHFATTNAAWNLSRALSALNEVAASERVIHDHLLWLLDRDPATLSADQRRIRGYLIQLGQRRPQGKN